MSINPFEELTTYSSFVFEQIESLFIDESKHVDLGVKSIEDFRMTVAYLGRKHAKKFSVKVAPDGGVWVKRIS
jgi:hypothetical protein